VGSQSRSVRYGEVKILDPTGNRTPIQPVVSHYTDCSTAALCMYIICMYIICMYVGRYELLQGMKKIQSDVGRRKTWTHELVQLRRLTSIFILVFCCIL
jgi:hypothetical protein